MDATSAFQGIGKESTAYKLLASMGWEEGQGLGAQKQGITSHVRVRKKADSSGVGAAQELARARDWTLGMAAYDRVLASLKVVAAAVPTDTAEAPKNRQKKKRAEGQIEAKKRRRIEAPCSEAVQPEGALAETPGQGDEQPAKRRAATHVGRFRKAVKGKLVTGYSTTDLAAILGGLAPAAVASEPIPDGASAEAARPITGDEPRGVGAGKAERPASSPETSPPTVNSKAWWGRTFTRAGKAGSASLRLQSKQPDPAAGGFSEGDQAALWQACTDAQSRSHRGLGQADASRKVGGARWSGVKTKLGSDSEGEAASPCRSDENSEDEEKEAATQAVVIPSKRQQALLATPPKLTEGGLTTLAPRAVPAKKPLKWRKLARAILGSAEGSMRLKAFKSRAWEVAKQRGAVDRSSALHEMLRVLTASRQFQLSPQRISLKA